MAKRSRSIRPTTARLGKPRSGQGRPGIVHSSLYLPEAVHEALRETAFEERRKIHDLILDGIEQALRKRGYPSISNLKAKYERKGR